MTSKSPTGEFVSAFIPAQRIMGQIRAHADLVEERLIDALVHPAAGTVIRADHDAAAGNAAREVAQEQVIHELNSASFAVTSFVRSIAMHFNHDPFYAASAAVLVRPLLDVVATGAWLIDNAATIDMRHARGCVWTLRTMEQGVYNLSTNDNEPPTIVEELKKAKQDLIEKFQNAGVTINQRVAKGTGAVLDEVGLVRIGRATAKAGFKYTERVQKYVGIRTPYGMLSGAVHGEQLMLNSISDHPAAQARFIAWTTFQAVVAWSSAVHAYIGTQPAPFVNGDDVARLKASIPEELRDEFELLDTAVDS